MQFAQQNIPHGDQILLVPKYRMFCDFTQGRNLANGG